MAQHAPSAGDGQRDLAQRAMLQRPELAAEEVAALLGPPLQTPVVPTMPLAGESPSDIDDGSGWLHRAEQTIAALAELRESNELPAGVQSYRLSNFAAENATASGWDELAGHAELSLRIELGHTHLPRGEARQIRRGTVVALDSTAHEPVAVYANGRLIGRGEVVVVEGKLAVRMLELVAKPKAKAG